MNLTELAGIGGQINVSNGTDALTMRKTLDQQSMPGESNQQVIVAATSTGAMERSVMPHLGGKIDISA